MCDYQGYEFGAGRYPDSYCVDGFLHDADSDFLNEDQIPCPACNPDKAIDWWAEQNAASWKDDEDENDEAGHNERARITAISLVNDIRKNRGLPLVAHNCGSEAR